MPLNLIYMLLLFFVAIFLVALIHIGIITIALDKLGISPFAGMLILFGSLLGSSINIPLFAHPGNATRNDMPGLDRFFPQRISNNMMTGKTLVMVNVGGCLIPVAVSLYLFIQQGLALATTGMALGVVTLVSYLFSRPIRGIGIGMPMFVAPITSALTAILLDPMHSAPLAYISGTLGVLIGADLLRLYSVDRMGLQVASIGGAGTFDGIFFTGIIAVLLA